MSGNLTSCLWYEFVRTLCDAGTSLSMFFLLHTILRLCDYDLVSRVWRKTVCNRERERIINYSEKFARDRQIIGMREMRYDEYFNFLREFVFVSLAIRRFYLLFCKIRFFQEFTKIVYEIKNLDEIHGRVRMLRFSKSILPTSFAMLMV